MIDFLWIAVYNTTMPKIELSKSRYNSYLDGEWLYRYYWLEMGSARSIRKLVAYCRSQGIINPETMREATAMAVWFSLWTWAVRNSDAAYEIFQKVSYDEGKYYTTAEWDEFIELKAQTAFKKGSRRFINWQKNHQKT
jgi:hypothetical protein